MNGNRWSVRDYLNIIENLSKELVIEAAEVETLDKTTYSNSVERDSAERLVYARQHKKAKGRLGELSDINPPVNLNEVHEIYLKAFRLGMEARKQVLNEDFFKASAAYELSGQLLGRADRALTDMGL